MLGEAELEKFVSEVTKNNGYNGGNDGPRCLSFATLSEINGIINA